jgi:4-hydroxythreonine-4-phosphate dehydrogenase
VNAATGELKPIALTCGDPAGIGADITLAGWLCRASHALPTFAYLGDIDHLRARAASLGLDVPCMAIRGLHDATRHFPDALPVLPIPLPHPIDAGKADGTAVPAVQASIEAAVGLALDGTAAAVVTNPIAKHVMAGAGFAFPGHTEFLGWLAERCGGRANPVMMLVGGGLRVVPVTVHIPLAAVPRTLTTQMIVDTAKTAAAGLSRWFGITDARLALTGLNPHAGEGGLMGDEEDTIIEPAIRALRQAGLTVTGPHPADTLFHDRARSAYDAALAMYHDQALIPLKTLAFDEGVNVTLGLPFIRTSPDHGTAFDLAGTGKARPDSLIAALRLATKMAEMDRAGLSNAS